MKRSLSPEHETSPSPPSSPIISKCKHKKKPLQSDETVNNDHLEENPENCENDVSSFVEKKRNPTSDEADDCVKFTSLLSLLSRGEARPQLTSGCPLLDSALGGGLRPGELAEVVGGAGAGKTQLCLQWGAETAARGHHVIYINTEGAFPVQRLDQMLEARNKMEAMDRIMVKHVKNLHQLMVVLDTELEAELRNNDGVRLVIVDSVASVIRYDGELGPGLGRAQMIHTLGHALLRVARVHGVAVVAVNQVTDLVTEPGAGAGAGPVRPHAWGRGQVASLGGGWAQQPHLSLWVARTRLVVPRLPARPRLRTLAVDRSSRLARTTAHFYVDTAGCHGVNVVD